MVVTEQASQARYYARLALMFGFILLLFMLLLSAWEPFSRYRLAQSWPTVEAKVLSLAQLCDVEVKFGSNWRKEATLPCGETEAYIAAHRSPSQTTWQTIPREFAEIAYAAGGEQRVQKLRRLRVAAAPVAVGDVIPILVDPAHPLNVDRPPIREDFAPVWRVGIGGLAMALLLLAAGWLGGRYSDRRPAEPLR